MDNVVNPNSIGMPKSGMPWKKNRKRPAIDKAISKKRYDDQKKAKGEMKELRDKIKSLEDARKEVQAEHAKRRREHVKQKKLNEIKSSTYQEISNTRNVKRWKLKAKKQLMSLPKEVFYANIK